MHSLVRALASIALLSLLACGGGDAEPESAATPPTTGAATAAESDDDHGHDHAEHSRRRPLPSFGGYTLAGTSFSVSELLGQRTLLFFFNPEAEGADEVATAVARIATERAAHNFRIQGIAVGAPTDVTKAFVEKHGLDFGVVDDTTGEVGRKLRIRQRLLFVGVDREGDIAFVSPGAYPGVPDIAAAAEAELRSQLRLPGAGRGGPELGNRPQAPDFTTEQLGSDETLQFASFRGRPVVLIFFLHTCPHCHEMLKVLKDILSGIDEEQRPALVGVSIANRPLAVETSLQDEDLDFFPVVFDPGSEIRNDYGVLAGVPATFLIDAEGRIARRFRGFDETRDPALVRMSVSKLAGVPVPMLLHSTGYSGNDACGVCHQAEHETWQLTRHSTAYDTLVRHGAETDDECIGCHVVGWGQDGGFRRAAFGFEQLENVGCESCHGRGGPHLSPGFVPEGGYESVCKTCHNPTHSLGFEYAKFLPNVSHAANLHLTGLSVEEKRKLLEERGLPRDDLLGGDATYVGSDACKSCHSAEFETWVLGPHARAHATLETAGEASNDTCLQCHTTGFGRGGFSQATAAAGDDLARVGCESCHGPGSEHVGETARRVGTILSLTDKCDSCVILQICGSCHDEANDPGFEFNIEAKIEAQRHGTIEPAATRGLQQDAASPSARGGDVARLLDALRAPVGAEDGSGDGQG